MESVGNDNFNSIYEFSPSESVQKATKKSSREAREVWIKTKYLDRSMVPKPKEGMHLNLVSFPLFFLKMKELYGKVSGENIMDVLLLLAQVLQI